MTQKILALYDDRPFFERALKHGVSRGIVTQQKVNEILENGPQGILQIAQTFGTEYLRPDILSARYRMVNLVSLYLEKESQGSLEKAAEIIAENNILTQSKGGSDMIKSIYRLPETPIMGTNTFPVNMEDYYNTYAPGKHVGAKLSERYKHDVHIRTKHKNTIQTAEWLVSKFPRLDREDFSGYNAEGILLTLVLSSLDGFGLAVLPTKNDILEMVYNRRGKILSWTSLLTETPDPYKHRIEKITILIDKILEKTSITKDDLVVFESGDDDIRGISAHDEQIAKRWKEITGGRLLTREEKQTILFTALAGGKPQMEITEIEAKRMLQYLTDNTPSHDSCIEYFMENNIPFEYHSNIRANWEKLAKEMNSLYGEGVPMKTKLWILSEGGCNIKKSSRKSTKKVTTPPK